MMFIVYSSMAEFEWLEEREEREEKDKAIGWTKTHYCFCLITFSDGIRVELEWLSVFTIEDEDIRWISRISLFSIALNSF